MTSGACRVERIMIVGGGGEALARGTETGVFGGSDGLPTRLPRSLPPGSTGGRQVMNTLIYWLPVVVSAGTASKSARGEHDTD